MDRLYGMSPHGPHPVYFIAQFPFRELCQLRVLFFSVPPVAVMTLFTVGPIMTECGLSVMATASSAEPPGLVRCLSDLRSIHLHVEFELEMAHPAGEFHPVSPVRKRRGFHAAFLGGPVDEYVAVFGRRRGRRETPPWVISPLPWSAQKDDKQQTAKYDGPCYWTGFV